MLTDEQLLAKYGETVRKFRPIDDTFMRVLFRDNLPLTEYVLRIITGTPDLEIISENAQHDLFRQDGGRSVCLDVFARDSKGTLYDIEVQRADKGASPKRARYHSSAMDVEFLDKGEDFDSLHETYVIFITENDIFREGELAYHFIRTSLSGGRPLEDGTHIMYLNASYSRPGDSSELAMLMHDFLCSDPEEMETEMLEKEVNELKSKKGDVKMCKIVEDLFEKLMEEEKRDILRDSAKKALAAGIPIDKTAEILSLPIETVESIDRDMQKNTVNA